jgi:hypothetical protein
MATSGFPLLIAELYDKRDDCNFPIAHSIYMLQNYSSTCIWDIYISVKIPWLKGTVNEQAVEPRDPSSSVEFIISTFLRSLSCLV